MSVQSADPSVISVRDETQISGAELVPNEPNPFSQSTLLRFRLAESEQVALRIISLDGKVVRELASRDFPAGMSELPWDGRDRFGRPAPSGCYFALLQAGRQRSTRRLLLAR